MDLEIILRNVIYGDNNSRWNFPAYVKHSKENNPTIQSDRSHWNDIEASTKWNNWLSAEARKSAKSVV